MKNIPSDHTVAAIKAKRNKELELCMAQQSDEGIETEMKALQRKGKYIKSKSTGSRS